MPETRKIIHVDMDAFFTSVEQRDQPDLKGKPVVVGGSPTGRGVVAAASYEARKYGVRSAMSSAKALRLCPHLVFVKSDFSKYIEVSKAIRAVFEIFTDLVEPLSLDEAYLDVTDHCAKNRITASFIAREIKKAIREKTGLTASAGVGPNKFIAKVASDFRKPDGLVVVAPERVSDFVNQLKVEQLWGVGPATTAKLHAIGLQTAKDIRNYNPDLLEDRFGKFGRWLYELSHGRDDRRVKSERKMKSRGAERTLCRNSSDLNHLRELLREQAERIGESLSKRESPGRTVTLKVRYPDFSTITRSRTLPSPTDRPSVLETTAYEMLVTQTEAATRSVRLIGLSVSGFVDPEESYQYPFPFLEG